MTGVVFIKALTQERGRRRIRPVLVGRTPRVFVSVRAQCFSELLRPAMSSPGSHRVSWYFGKRKLQILSMAHNPCHSNPVPARCECPPVRARQLVLQPPRAVSRASDTLGRVRVSKGGGREPPPPPPPPGYLPRKVSQQACSLLLVWGVGGGGGKSVLHGEAGRRSSWGCGP